VQAWRDLPVLQRQHGLDQAGDAGGRVEVADVRLDRSHRTEPLPGGGSAERAGQGGKLDRITQRGRGAVRLDVVDGVRGYLGHVQRLGDHLGLAGDARRGVPDPRRTVVVHRRAEDHRVYGVPTLQRVLQPFERHDPHAGPAGQALRPCVEGPAVAVRRGDAALAVEVTAPLR
jgi:hypothetical protein